MVDCVVEGEFAAHAFGDDFNGAAEVFELGAVVKVGDFDLEI